MSAVNLATLTVSELLALWDAPERPDGWNDGDEHHLADLLITGLRAVTAAPSDTDDEYQPSELAAALGRGSQWLHDNVHKSRGCIGCDICTIRSMMQIAAERLSRSQPVQVTRDELADAMIASDALSDDVRAEARVAGSTQREPFLMFADAVMPFTSQPVQVEVTEFPFEHKGVTIEEDGGGLWITQGGSNPHQWISPRARAALSAALGGGE